MDNTQSQLENFLQATLSDDKISATEKSTIVKNILESKKAYEDSQKAIVDTDNAKKPQPKEGLKLFISTIAPMITAVALIATLWFQISQGKENKQIQIQAEEDKAWRKLLEEISSPRVDGNLTLPVIIKSFNNSEKYRNQIREITSLFLGNIAEPNYFKTVFNDFVKSPSWESLPQLVTLSNILKNQFFRAENAKDSASKFAFDEEINYVGQAIVNILKSNQTSRPKTINLSGVFFRNQNLDSINFTGANISGVLFNNCSVRNTIFTDVAEFKNSYHYSVWDRTAWWRAAKIDHNLVQYLKENEGRKEDVAYFQLPNDNTDYKITDPLQYYNFTK